MWILTIIKIISEKNNIAVSHNSRVKVKIMADNSESSENTISITVKTPKEKQDVKISPDASVKEV